jgi:hypothetical protein
VLYGDSVTAVFRHAFVPFYEEATRLVPVIENLGMFDSSILPHGMENWIGVALSTKVQLRKARLMIESHTITDAESIVDIRRICSEIVGSAFTCSEDKAWSLYYLGLLELEEARQSGTLHERWQNDDFILDDSQCMHLCAAKDFLSRASLYTMNASDVLTRNILRSLALASGPSDDGRIGMSSGVLVLTSIGQSLRRRMTWSFSSGTDKHGTFKDQNLWQHIFSTFDGPLCEDVNRDSRIADFFSQLAKLTPSNWTFLAPVICPTGEVLVSCVEKLSSTNEYTISTRCIFPANGMTGYDCIMKPLDTILKQVQEQLHSVDPMSVSDCSDKEIIKRRWWEERGRLDDDLGALLCKIETMLFPEGFDYPGGISYDDLPRGNLAARFDEVLEQVPKYSSLCHNNRSDDFKHLTVPKLKEWLANEGVDETVMKKLRKSELIELLIKQENKDAQTESSCTGNELHFVGREVVDDCLFLILDENLHRLPFEGMPLLEKKTICRVPCLSFVLSMLYELGVDNGKIPSVNPAKTTYVLDPEKSLEATRSRILPVIKASELSGNWKWNGIVGKAPSHSFFHRGLMAEDGLLIYFGHGGAQTCFSRRQIEELIDHRVQAIYGHKQESRCRASVVLMGCSSGRLVSINRKHSESIEQIPLFYEPEGVALSYLCAGAPCVVGNLWDVTDNDIDR